MGADDKPRTRLAAARPAARDESAGYLPRIPWRLVLLGLLSIATVVGGYTFNERRKADQLRAQIVQVHEQELAEPARRYRELRGKLENWVLEAARRPPESFADPRLRLSGLRSGKGLYLRLSAKDAVSRKAIAAGARSMQADAIPSCLGVAPASARAIWESGDFLMPEWLKDVRNDKSVMSLRVTDTMLTRRLKVDLPSVLNLLRSDWFLLVLQHGDDRLEAPVDVFLWDLRRSQQLLRGRIQSSGALFSVRVRSKDAPASPVLPAGRARDGAAQDCSIAAKIQQLAGASLTTVENLPTDALKAPGAPAAAPQPATTPPAAPAP